MINDYALISSNSNKELSPTISPSNGLGEVNNNIYGFLYAPSSKFRITEYGWGFFTESKIDFRKEFMPHSFDLPITLDSKGIIARVHLWRPEAKTLNLYIEQIPKENYLEILHVPVQYSSAGGTYHINSMTPLRMFSNKISLRNTFADYDGDNGGFV